MPPMKGDTHGPVKFSSIKKGTLLQLLGCAKPYAIPLILVLLCIIAAAVTSTMTMTIMETIIDDHIKPLMLAGSTDFSALLQVIIRMAVLFGISIVANLLQGIIMATVSQGILRDIRNRMFRHMQTLPIRYFDTHTFGDTMSHYTNDTDTLRQMISQSIPQFLSSIVTIFSIFVAMLTSSIPLTLFVLLSVVAMMAVTAGVGKNSAAYFVAQQKSLGQVNGFIEEMISGQRVIKVFCHEPQSMADFDRKNEELCHNATKANTFANILMPIMGNLGHMQYVLVAVLGGAMAIFSGEKLLTLGALVAFLTLSKNFTRPITQISQQMNSVIMALAGADRIFTLLGETPEADNGYVTLVNAEEQADGTLTEADHRTGLWAWKHPHEDGTLTYTKVTGDVRMHEVDFAYVEDKLVLQDVSLYAKPGQKIAFVGATGAGKTTITNLINRFYDIDDGKIRYDGININKIRKPDLRRSLGVVLQDVNLFTGTVLENIRYGKLDATDEECIAAAKLANAHDFITRLPQGYHTVLSGDGSGLSQGQRQLLSIARAAVADPPVMILDEATSSIDTRTEAIVQRGMDQLMKGRTVFVIAHRLSTVQNSNAIMVLDHGRIIERGDHDDLIAQQGTYYRLYTGSFELE